MFYSNLLRLCSERGISPSALLVHLGISKAGLKRWRDGTEPSNPIKKKLADYFGITVEELVSGQIKAPTLQPEGERSDLDNELTAMLRRLTPEQADKVRCFVQGILSAR